MSEFLLSHFSKILVFGCDQEASQYFRTLLKTSGIDSTHRDVFKKSKIIEIGSRRKKLQPPKVDDFSGKINGRSKIQLCSNTTEFQPIRSKYSGFGGSGDLGGAKRTIYDAYCTL